MAEAEDHTHCFVFLRQEKKNIGFDRDPIWLIEDLYFCEQCLDYRRIAVKKQRPRSDSFTEVYTERIR